MSQFVVKRNLAGNCLTFEGSSNPVFFNNTVSAEINSDNSNNINIVNDIRTGTGAHSNPDQYEFWDVPYTTFCDEDGSNFASAQAAIDYINERARVLDTTGRFILDANDTLDFSIDSTRTSIFVDNGSTFPVGSLTAAANDDNHINITSISGNLIIFKDLRLANASIDGATVTQTLATAVNELNSLFGQTGGSTAPTITSSGTITIAVGGMINYEATTSGGDVSAFEWTNLPEGVTQVTNQPHKIIGGSALNAGTYNMSVRAHNYSGVAKKDITLNVTQDYTNSKSTSFDDTEYTIRTRQTGEFSNLYKPSGAAMPAHSYSMWFKAVSPGASQPNNQSVFFAFSQLGTFSGTSYIDLRWLGPGSSNQRLRLQYAVSGSSDRLTLLTDTGTIPANGTWKHIVVTYDGASNGLAQSTPYTLKIYINGSEVITSSGDFSQGGGVLDSDGPIEPVYVGFGRNPNGFYLRQSLIDEFGYWDQELTATQVSNLYNSGVPTDLTTFTPSAAHVYRMGDGDTFPTIEDKVGNADQTMTNMASSNFVSDSP